MAFPTLATILLDVDEPIPADAMLDAFWDGLSPVDSSVLKEAFKHKIAFLRSYNPSLWTYLAVLNASSFPLTVTF